MAKAQRAQLARPVACGLQRFESDSLCASARQPPYQLWGDYLAAARLLRRCSPPQRVRTLAVTRQTADCAHNGGHSSLTPKACCCVPHKAPQLAVATKGASHRARAAPRVPSYLK